MCWDIVTFSLGVGIDAIDIGADVLHFESVEFPKCEEILVVNDASKDVGSGGSALNALIRTAERLCHRNGFAVLTETVLEDVNVLIVLVSDKRALLNAKRVVAEGNGYVFETYLSQSMKNATLTAEKSRKKGVWIIGSDSEWLLEKQPPMFDLPQDAMTGFTFKTSEDCFREHGRYKISTNDGGITRKLVGMKFEGDEVEEPSFEIETDESHFVILGFVYMPFAISSTFLSFHSQFPVAASTYLGVDSNVTPLKLSIFFDFLLATVVSQDKFVENKLGTHLKVSENVEDRSIARKQIFEKFNEFHGVVVPLDISGFDYKKFPNEKRNYSNLMNTISQEFLKNPDQERSIRTHLSIQNTFENRNLSSDPSLLISNLRDVIHEKNSPEVQLQVIFTTSLILSIASKGRGGLRNGPARNPKFAFQMQNGNMQKYLLDMMDEILMNWVRDPSKMIRAARHLETAAQYLIRRVVEGMCEKRTLRIEPNPSLHLNSVKVTAPARIDFFGGWLDTPPIFFSIPNAAVVNMAIQLDGKNPISCVITKIDRPIIEVCQDNIRIEIKDEKDLLYVHDKPTETGALVCACILALKFTSLTDFFSTLNCTGLRIETRSDLPHGSGLGTSSTIAATILKAISLMGRVERDIDEKIVHTVLQVEQIMTTGGGWQDQIGSLYPGLKKCFYVNGEDSKIGVKQIPLDSQVVEILERRLLLVYTGKTRLAKNLLQEVIRNFFTCPVTKLKLGEMAELVSEFGEKLARGEMDTELLEKYHETKKFMTKYEPAIVTELLDTLRSSKMIEVGWAAGAGGGGFLYLWLSESTSKSQVEHFIDSNVQFSKMTCHSITIPTDCPFECCVE